MTLSRPLKGRPDMTYVVGDWALKANYLSIYPLEEDRSALPLFTPS